MSERSKKKNPNPCGHCKEECKSGNSIPCGFCEFWFHSKCIDGMTQEFIDTCDQMNKLFGGSAFLCVICRKLATKINKSIKDFDTKMEVMEARLKAAELERKLLAERVEKMENRSEQVKDRIVGMEKEIETGMEKAKEEVKNEMATEMKDREERESNVVVYGIQESKAQEAKDRKEEDGRRIRKMAEVIGVEIRGEIEVKFRAGKRREAEGEEEESRPRPMVVRIEDEETRQRLLQNARKLAREEEWRKVFVSPDLTWQQREEARKEEKRLREEAENKTEEAKNGGREGGRYVVVGPRGRRRIVWREERDR